MLFFPRFVRFLIHVIICLSTQEIGVWIVVWLLCLGCRLDESQRRQASLLQHVQTSSRAHTTLYFIGTRGAFSWCKVTGQPLMSACFRDYEWVEPYLHYPSFLFRQSIDSVMGISLKFNYEANWFKCVTLPPSRFFALFIIIPYSL